ncbi:MAG TPA: B12-binding domain-containing protein [Solirubrobacterales bacterium]|nr:B12-binding domain-containing protein [Solirubrobacterales bacterium]
MRGTRGKLSRLYLEALRAGDGPGAYRVATRALREGMGIPDLYQRVVAPAMHEIGVLWERGALTVADEHRATELTNRVLAALRPTPGVEESQEPGASARSQALLAAVEGERHALGLRMAADILEDNGFETVYLGADVPTNALLQAIAVTEPNLVVLAATLPTLAPKLEEVVATVREADPAAELLFGGRAASPRIAGGTLIESLEQLPELVLPRR